MYTYNYIYMYMRQASSTRAPARLAALACMRCTAVLYVAIFLLRLSVVKIYPALHRIRIYGRNVSYITESLKLVEYCCMKMTNIMSRFQLALYTIGTCLDKIYVTAFTSSLRFSDSTHPHNIEVVAAGQTRKILMPDRPGNYESHRGDIWKMSISEDLGFLPGTCLRYV